MENSPGDGYITEKIVDSFNAGTIPIYFGDYLIDEYVNPKTYILIKGEKDIDEKIEYIKKIDKDDKLYMDIMKENPIIDDKAKDKIDKSDIKEFLSKYKFSIAMENSPGDGYVTEKIVDSFNAGTIPIYYGDYLVDEYVNPKTYILIRGEKDVDEKIEYIKKLIMMINYIWK